MLMTLLGIIVIIVVCALIGIVFKLTGVTLKALLWLLVELPFGIILWATGIVFCCTIILIPIGKACFKAGTNLIIPG